MKVTMPEKILSEALKRGAFAALSDAAQKDTSILSLLIKAVKIKVSKTEIDFESATSLIASRYTLPVTSDIVVKEEGEVMIAAKEFSDWVGKQKNCIVGMRLKPLDSPEMVNVVSEEAEEAAGKAAIKKLGTVEIISQDSSKTGAKWSLDSYDSAQIPLIDFDLTTKPLFVLPLEQLVRGLGSIGFVTLPQDPEHLFDAISFQHKNSTMYMIASDYSRCAIYRLPNADKITMPSTITVEELEKSGMDNAWKHTVLLPFRFLNSVCKLFDETVTIDLYRDDKTNRVYVMQPGFILRMATADQDKIGKFPPLDLFLTKKYQEFCKVPRELLGNRLDTVSMVNKKAVLFDFKDDKLILHGVSDSGKSPSVANISLTDLPKEAFKKVWNVRHFQDIISSLKDDDLQILIPEDEEKDSLKIVSSDDQNVTHYAMEIEQSNYDLSEE